MRVPLAPAGRREILLLTLFFGGAAALFYALAGTGRPWLWPVGIVFTLIWLAGLAFFRDPERLTPGEADIMVSPADGRVTEMIRLEHHDDIGGPALRIGIFLSIFDVHINRSPCDGLVRSVHYQPGKFLDARHPQCGECNEANTIVMDTTRGPVVVRQVAGLIARRIVCAVKPGDTLRMGQRIGLIKFGSRTELIVPFERLESSVRVGEMVAGGSTIIMRHRSVVSGQLSVAGAAGAAPTS